jgi:predicted component of type VI protein secretion system
VGKLDVALSAHLPRPPAFRRMKDVLGMLRDLARDGMRAAGEEMPAAAGASAAGGAEEARLGVAAFSGGTGPIGSRTEAYYRLAEAAEYLLRTEPHSPVPYLVKRAVQWGNMSLTELLYEFIGNPDDLVMIQRLLGMRGKD